GKPSFNAGFVSSKLTMNKSLAKGQLSRHRMVRSCEYAKVISLHFASDNNVLLAGDCKSNLVVFERKSQKWTQCNSIRVTAQPTPVHSICVCRNEYIVLTNGNCQNLYYSLLSDVLSLHERVQEGGKDSLVFQPLKRHRSDKLESFLLEWDKAHDCLYVCSRKLTCYQLTDKPVELKKLNTITEPRNDSKDWIATLSVKTNDGMSYLIMSRSEDHMFRSKQPYVTLVFNSNSKKTEEWKSLTPFSDSDQPYKSWPVADCVFVGQDNISTRLVTCLQKLNPNNKTPLPYFVLHSLSL
ncbi:hypothetical protein RFI_34485, partial [Reticulomyxa filosa]